MGVARICLTERRDLLLGLAKATPMPTNEERQTISVSTSSNVHMTDSKLMIQKEEESPGAFIC